MKVVPEVYDQGLVTVDSGRVSNHGPWPTENHRSRLAGNLSVQAQWVSLRFHDDGEAEEAQTLNQVDDRSGSCVGFWIRSPGFDHNNRVGVIHTDGGSPHDEP